MREIKFRAWGENKMMYPEQMDTNLLIITPVGKICYVIPSTEYSNKELIWTDYKLMQYTGLKDKNGKEIYEGDIVKTVHGNEIYKVEYHQSTFMYIGKERNQYPNHNLSSNSEIIGNIYENPELLNV